ncbi:MAG: TldD/PmbA family protein [Synergistaceae bacterium]|nr:TldD/PmbA family protein [Synergistaceae bacterium]
MTPPISRGRAEDAASFLLRRAKEKGAAGADVLYTFRSGQSLALCDGKPEKDSSGTSIAVGLRTIDREGRQGVAHSNSLDREFLENIVEWSLQNCSSSEADPHIFLADGPLADLPDLDLTDSSLSGITGEQRMAWCKEMDEVARASDPRVLSVRSASWSDGGGEVLYASTSGVSGWYGGTSGACGLAVIMQDGEAMEMGGYGEESRSLAGLSPARTAREAVRRTALILGGEPLDTGRYDLLLDGEAASSLIDVLGELFLASAIHKNTSLLKGKMGKKVASSSMTLTDDGLLRRGLGSAPFDGEGVPCRTTRILSDGVVEGWLYNLKYASLYGTASTGNADRSASSVPDVACSNLSLSPGPWSREDMLLQIAKGLYVTEFLGLHTINPVSGDYSVGIKGASIEGGEIGVPFSGMTIAGNLKDFLFSVDLVGKDFAFYGSTGASSMLVRDIAAAGR